MANTAVKKEPVDLSEVACDEEVALVAAATDPAVDDDPSQEDGLVIAAGPGGKTEAQLNGAMVLSLLDKIIGVVDQIQHTQSSLEARQEAMEKSVSSIQGELAKLCKNHLGTTNTVNKMLDKVRKVSVNVKTVRGNLEKQAGQIKKLESNENELLKRRDFKVLIYQDKVKQPKPAKAAETAVESAAVEGLGQIVEGEEGEAHPAKVNSDEEVEIEEIIEESRTKRLQRSTKKQVDNIKKAFSKEQMEKTKVKTKENLEKTKQKTRENLEKTKQKTRDNLEKTKHSLEKKIGKLGTRMTPNQERRAKMKSSKDRMKKSLTPDHTVYARSKTSVYRVPPFTFHVKKIRDGEEEIVESAEMVEVTDNEVLSDGEENGVGGHVEEEELVSSPQNETLLVVTEDAALITVEGDQREKAQ
ncbi:caveolae-associated protein 1 [Neosynchiropus ocellatus]